MQFLERSSVIAVIDTFGDEEIGNAIKAFPIYNDDANHETGSWESVTRWELFEPDYVNNSYTMRKIIFHSAICSNCDANITIDDYDQYCPRCGAKMEYSE